MSNDPLTQVNAAHDHMWSKALWIAAVALLYFLVAQFSLTLVFKPVGIAAIWPPSGVFLSAILLTRRSARPYLIGALFAADLVAENLAGTPFLVSLAYAASLTVDAILSAWLLLHFVGGPILFRRTRDVIGFLFLSVLLSNALTSVIAASAAKLYLGVPFWSSWFWWWSSDAVGNLLVTPLILSWAVSIKTIRKDFNKCRALEYGTLFLLLVFLNNYAFSYLKGEPWFGLLLNLFAFPFLMWASLRFGMTGAATTSLILAILILGHTFRGDFLFLSSEPILTNAILAQIYIAMTAIPSILLAALFTEHKQAEEKITRSEAELRALFASMHDVVLVLDRDGVYRKVVPTNPHLLAMPADELLGQSLRDVFPDEQANTFIATIRQVLQAQNTVQIEYQLAIGNRTIWFETTISPVDGYNTIWVARDITERKWAENQIQDALNYVNTFISNSPIGIVTFKATGEIVSANEALLKMIGATSSERVLTQNFRQLKSWKQSGMLAAAERALAGGQVQTIETYVLSTFGRGFWVSCQFVPFQYQGSSRLLAVMNDITERKRVEEAIQASERRLSEALRVAKMGCWEYDIPSGLFTFNDQYYALHRTTSAAAGGDQMTAEHFARNLVHPDDAHLVQETINQAIAATDASFQLQLECRILCADGETRWVVVWFRVEKDEAGRTIKLHGVNQDIHERKQAEEKVRRHASRVESLARTATQINRQLDLNTTLTRVCEEVARALDTQASMIVLTDSIYQTINAITGYGLPIDFRDDFPSVPLSTFIEGLAVSPDTPIVFHDQKKFSDLLKEDLFAKYDVHTMVVAPIKGQVQMIGALVVLSIGKPRQYDTAELSFLQALADEAAQAIINSHLLEDARRRLNRLEALRTIDNAIAASLDLSHTLSVFLGQLRNQLNVDAADILLFNSRSLTLEYASGVGMRTDLLKRVQLYQIYQNDDPAGQVVSSRQRVQIPDIRKAANFARTKELLLEEFVSYYGVPLIAKGQMRGVLEIFHRAPELHDKEWLDFLEALARQAAISIDNAALFDELQKSNLELTLAYEATIEGWSRAMDLRDKETEGHTRRVTELTYRLAQAMGFHDEDLAHLRRGAMLHDIGKMGIPDEILLKPGRLNKAEEIAMKKHPQYAYEMLSSISYLKPSLDIPYCHHEKWDGSGYPRGLAGEQIPLSARLFAIVDVWDALISDRPYRAAWSKDKAIDYIQQQSGKHFDPEIVKIFMGTIATDESL